jgi:hypothetical protein
VHAAHAHAEKTKQRKHQNSQPSHKQATSRLKKIVLGKHPVHAARGQGEKLRKLLARRARGKVLADLQ